MIFGISKVQQVYIHGQTSTICRRSVESLYESVSVIFDIRVRGIVNADVSKSLSCGVISDNTIDELKINLSTI